MPVFISYSHKNKEFVDKLAKQLVFHNIHVWVDRWELNIGDSIIDKVQEAVQGATALLVILSKDSVESDWCKRELSAGLLRELEEKRVVVMPVLYEDCNIPLFARGKLYADFRNTFDDGLRTILEGIAKVTNPTMSRETEEKYHTDWSIDYGKVEDKGGLILTFIQHSIELPYSCLTIIEILMSDHATMKYFKTLAANGEEIASLAVVAALKTYLNKEESYKVILKSAREVFNTVNVDGSDKNESYRVRIGTRRLGEDTGKEILINITGLVNVAYRHMFNVVGSHP